MHNDFLAFSNLTDEELIRLVQNRNEAAFAELISRWTPRIRGVIAANSRQRRDAEEIHTDIWVAVWQNIRELRNVDSFGAWLHRIAFNACKRYYTLARQSRNEVPHQQSVLVEHIDQHAAARHREAQLIADVQETIHNLPQKVRSVAELFYLESWSIKEIAEEFNLAIGTVKTKLREIRTLLREEFDVEPIRGGVMSSKSVESHSPIQIETNITEPSRKPAAFNVVANDPTGNTWALPEGAIVRFGKGNTRGIRLSPNGKFIAVPTELGLWWYDVLTTLPVSLWEPGEGHVFSFDFSPDGKWIIIYTGYRTIKVMDIQSGECVMQIDDQDAYVTLTCSSNGKWIATASMKGVVKVLDVQTGECIAQMDRGKHEWKSNDIHRLKFSPNGELLAATAGNPQLFSNDDQLLNPDTEGTQTYVWNPETGKPIIKFAGQDFVFSSDSRLLVGACADETLNGGKRVDRWVAVWDVTSREQITLFTEHDDWVHDIAISPCGQFVASDDGVLRVWEIATGSQKNVYPDFGDPYSLFYTKEGRLFALMLNSSVDLIEAWDVEQREKLFEMSIGIGALDLATAYTQQLSKTPNTKQADGKIPMYSIAHEPSFPWPGPLALHWLDDQTVVSNYTTGIALWDVNKKCIRDSLFTDDQINAITFLPSGKLQVTYFNREDRKVYVVSMPDQLIAKFSLPEKPTELVREFVFAPTGKYLASGSLDGTIYVWNLEQPEQPILLKGHTDIIYTVAFSLDGKRLVSGAKDGTARVWDVESSKEIGRLPIDEPCTPMDFVYSPCGNLIAGSLKNEIRFWCAKQFTKVRSIPQPVVYGQADPLAFSPCGRYLAGGTSRQGHGENLAIWIWDVNTCEQIHVFQGHYSRVESLAFSPNGTMLASGCFNGTILVWDLKPYL